MIVLSIDRERGVYNNIMDVEAKQVQRIGPVETEIQRSAYYKRYETRGERVRREKIRPGASSSVAACMRRDG